MPQAIVEVGGKAYSVKPHHNVVIAKPHILSEELGFVGQVLRINTGKIRVLLRRGMLPVIMPMGRVGKELYNINADDVAAAVAKALGAEVLIILADVPGILRMPIERRSVFKTLTVQQAETLIKNDKVFSGMVPKLEACLDAVRFGVREVYVLEADPEAIIGRLLLGMDVGTAIRLEKKFRRKKR